MMRVGTPCAPGAEHSHPANIPAKASAACGPLEGGRIDSAGADIPMGGSIPTGRRKSAARGAEFEPGQEEPIQAIAAPLIFPPIDRTPTNPLPTDPDDGEARASGLRNPSSNNPGAWPPQAPDTFDQLQQTRPAAEAIDGSSIDSTGRSSGLAAPDGKRSPRASGKDFTEDDYCPGCGMLRSQCQCWDPVNQPAATEAQWAQAHERARMCDDFRRLRLTMSGNQAAKELGHAHSLFLRWLPRYEAGGVEALLPRGRDAGRRQQFIVPEAVLGALRSLYLRINRTEDAGSVPEAVRQFIGLPEADRTRLGLPQCPEDFRSWVFERQRLGLALVPAGLRRRVISPASVVRQYRNPTEARLDFLNSPGSTMWAKDPATGARVFIRAGDLVEADDGTINFPCVVPWTIGGCPCSEKFGVKVGRFQWLTARDVGSRMFLGFTYVCRPRSSYRTEDVLSLIRVVCRAHGIPRGWRFERGVWEGNAVKGAIDRLGSKLHTVYSPHSKPYIEGGFNSLWTKLSLLDGQVGRFRGEMERENDLLTACKDGRRDPRGTFPMLCDAIAAFVRSMGEMNATRVESELYGAWVPDDRWESHLGKDPLPAWKPETDWLFAPFIGEWTVKGMLVGGKVPLFEGLSVPFDFAADWLPQYRGAKVRCHFDPTEAKCSATVVLAQNWGRARAGDVLGTAEQVNEVAGYARLVMGWGCDDPAAEARKVRQQTAAAMRREVRAILPRGRAGHASSEARDGLGNKAVLDGAGDGGQRSEDRGRRSEDRRQGANLVSGDRKAAAERFEAENILDFI